MIGKRYNVLIVCLGILLLASGCSSPLDSSSTDEEFAAPAPLGLDLCYECHAPAIFEEWLVSRHANFDLEDGTRVDYATMIPAGSTTAVAYSEITGDPDPHPTAGGGDRCGPCHTGPIENGNDGSFILSNLNAGGTTFTDPNIGQINRPLIDCESCHVSGAGHWGAASPPYVTSPAFHECTECHPPVEDLMDTFPGYAELEHYDHHEPGGNRNWDDSGGSSLYDAGGPSPALTTIVIASEPFDAYTISASWIASYGGSYYYGPHETINDTHYQGIWITDQPNELIVYTSSTAKFGYVDLTNTSPNTGMTRADSVDACTASCHGAHEFDLSINEQWFEGAHHPNIEGPLGTDGSDVEPAGPDNWGAVEHGYSASCVRCHTSMGFAEVAPGYGSAVETPSRKSDSFITCNACHDGVNYPEASNPRLRFDGYVPLFDYDGVPLTYAYAGNGAVCVYCHQARRDGSLIADDALSWISTDMPRYAGTLDNPVTFESSHYLVGGAVLYGEKAYEYNGNTYAGEHIHSTLGCVGCHMADDPISDEVGGHTFHMAHGTTEATTYCISSGCHPDMTALDDPWNTGAPTVADDISAMMASLEAALFAFDHAADGNTAPDIVPTSSNYKPATGQAWSPTTAAAAFNLYFFRHDPGAYAHNWKYTLQVLYDSYEDLRVNHAGDVPIPVLTGITRP